MTISSSQTFRLQQAAEHRQTIDHDIEVDPVLLEDQDSTAMGSQFSMDSHGRPYGQPTDSLSDHQRAMRLPGALPRSREDMQRPRMISTGPDIHWPSQQWSPLTLSEHPDASLIDDDGLWDGVLWPNAVPESRAAPTIDEAQLGADAPAPEETNSYATSSFRKRTGADAGFLTTDVNANLEDSGHDSWRLTRQSKCIKVSSGHDHTGVERERRIRKVSKLSLKIAEGKAPKKGSLGPNGEIRIRPDGLMEFRDVDNPMWSKRILSEHVRTEADKAEALAAYHNDYRRQFLNEAARDGEFGESFIAAHP